MVLAWAAAVILAPRVETSATVHAVALFAHLGSLLVGFGAVLLVDWFGLLLLIRASAATTLSQGAWWTAVLIGFLNSQ